MHAHHKFLVKRLTEHSQALALPDGRMVGDPGHDVARDYLLRQMGHTKLIPFHNDRFEISYERPHPITNQPQIFTNLVGVIPGQDRTLPPLLLGAHYDSVIDAPCVDDNATSVALTLAIAEEYALRPLQRDLIIAFFDAEEPPFFHRPTMGSLRFCEDYCQDIRFAAVIVSDLIGHDLRAADLSLPLKLDLLLPQLSKIVFVIGSESSAAFPEIVETTAGETKGIRVVPTLHRYVGGMSDHHAFAEQHQPFLFLSCAQGKFYHHPQDTMEWINFKKLARITRFVADMMERIDQDPAKGVNPIPCDPYDFEIRMLRKAIGPLLPLGLKLFGMKMPDSRKDLDHLMTGIVDRSLS